MLRGNSRLLLGVHQGLDLFLVAVACITAFYSKKYILPGQWGGLTTEYDYYLAMLISLLTYHISLRLFGCYTAYRNQKLPEILMKVVKSSLTGTAGVVFISYILHMDGISRLLLGMFTLTSIVLLVVFKTILYKILTYHRKRNYNTRNILIVGCRQRAIDFIKAVEQTPESGYRIIGCLETSDTRNAVGDQVYGNVHIIGTLESYNTILKELTIDEIVFGIPLKTIYEAHNYIYRAESMGINVKIVPDFQIDKIRYLPSTAKTSLIDFMGMPILSLSSLPTKDNELLIKNFLDYLIAAIGVIVLSPVFVLIALLIKSTSKGPIVFSQKRVGLNGRTFNIYKFRTMIENAEEIRDHLVEENEADGPVFKIQNDPRITSLGAFLRRTSLDELPQLINVLKGEMSLVGPRPPVPNEVDQYTVWQRRRLSMKPGLTCIWQVSGRNDINFERWMNMDLEYIDNWSLALDIKLLAMTLREVTRGGGR